MRPVSRVILKAASLASVPEFPKKTLAWVSRAEVGDQRLGERDARLGGVQVGRVAERVELPGDRFDDGGMTMPEHVDGDAAEQVYV